MATGSYLNNIYISNEKSCRFLILALEHARVKPTKNVSFKRDYKEIRGPEIRNILKKNL